MFRSRRSGLGQHGQWQDTQGNHSHTSIHLPIQQEPQTRGLDRYGSGTSAPPTPQRPAPMEHGKNRFKIALNWEELGENCQKICLREI
ncbi:hypothetical protein O181_031201 [Austropuccinia psidii MF-1]|uniref:Uncharacterized protein n=1 Tax=Austropuccinia psidii MF-1 TaxID=1389203 RepID=A0A9Q3H4Y8_9BASI|nr:hypothetical protein [Austropuccinia psidii MF-1]